MGQKRRDAVGAGELVERGYIGRIDGLGLAAARIAREELERVPVDGGRILGPSSDTLGAGQMTTDGEHGLILSTKLNAALASIRHRAASSRAFQKNP